MSDAYNTMMMMFRSQGSLIRGTDGKTIIGIGMFETDLEANGFPKSVLRKLVVESVMTKVTTRYKGGWRNTYVLPLPEGYKLDDQKTEKVQSQTESEPPQLSQ